ncbi:hypothetical protein KUTeg_007618 [Tegillarca granosa]|uniref:Uncharacterized protein n=1 Tax=Tegillarca granosa TaxID=220873 RepID=A0ABQ9FDR7_TEGGR|nr:hypothetical protein KUTeg_007618 [Tegillarca granosa]
MNINSEYYPMQKLRVFIDELSSPSSFKQSQDKNLVYIQIKVESWGMLIERDMPKRDIKLKRLNYGKKIVFSNEQPLEDKRRKVQKDRLNSELPPITPKISKDSQNITHNAMVGKNELPPIQRHNTERTQIIETFREKKKWRICEECSNIAKYTNDSIIKKQLKKRKNNDDVILEDKCVICDKNEASVTEVNHDQDNALLSLLYPRDFYDQFSREEKTGESFLNRTRDSFLNKTNETLFNRTKTGSNTQSTQYAPVTQQSQTSKVQSIADVPIKSSSITSNSTSNSQNNENRYSFENKNYPTQRKEFHQSCGKSNHFDYHSAPSISRITSDEFKALYRRQGFPGSNTSYTVNSLGLHFDIPEPRNTGRTTMRQIRTNNATKPKTILPPIKTAHSWSGNSGRLTM